LCPAGWHVPTDSDWTTLTTYLGGESVAGGKMKSTSSLWLLPHVGGRIIPAVFRWSRVVGVRRMLPSTALAMVRFFGVLRRTTTTVATLGDSTRTVIIVARTGPTSIRSGVGPSAASRINYLSICGRG